MPQMPKDHIQSRAQSYSRSQRRKVLKAKFGADWKAYEYVLPLRIDK